jgi:hypothetical protein
MQMACEAANTRPEMAPSNIRIIELGGEKTSPKRSYKIYLDKS